MTLSGEAFLLDYHAHHPGVTTEGFAQARLPDGRSSYTLLADDVASGAKDPTVLDIACGDGFLLEQIRERIPTAQLTGIDLSPHEIALARARLSDDVVLHIGSAESLPFENASVDAVTCHMALMLMDNSAAVLAEILRVLKPDATFASITPSGAGKGEVLRDFFGMLSELENQACLEPLQLGAPGTHQTESFTAVLRGCGFAEVRTENLNLKFFDVPFLLGMYNVGRLPASSQTQLSDLLAQHSSLEYELGLCHAVAKR
ncbi:MAG: class I SAM-dependent methyltransferase [Candidatus Eremiobacteraeota bacterium]|nr:class I SAM-dependent methyltransferase [Candidatus Eremiobacteraeota bacterium]